MDTLSIDSMQTIPVNLPKKRKYKITLSDEERHERIKASKRNYYMKHKDEHREYYRRWVKDKMEKAKLYEKLLKMGTLPK